MSTLALKEIFTFYTFYKKFEDSSQNNLFWYTSMTRIKVSCYDRLIVKHVFICGLNEPKQKCKRFCKYSQNMVRNAKFVLYRVQGTCYVTNLPFLTIFWKYLQNRLYFCFGSFKPQMKMVLTSRRSFDGTLISVFEVCKKALSVRAWKNEVILILNNLIVTCIRASRIHFINCQMKSWAFIRRRYSMIQIKCCTRNNQN